MDAEQKPAVQGMEAGNPPAKLSEPLPDPNASHADAGGRAGPAATDQRTEQWHLILLGLCAVGALLVIGILALQVTEYRFFRAPPNVWPQPGAGGTFSAPVTPVVPAAPLSPATAITSSVAPATVSAPESTAGQTSMPAAAASVSVPAPAAANP